MKPRKLKGKLSLNKKTISHLDGGSMARLHGGALSTDPFCPIATDGPETVCQTNTCNALNTCNCTNDWTCGEPDSVCVCSLYEPCNTLSDCSLCNVC